MLYILNDNKYGRCSHFNVEEIIPLEFGNFYYQISRVDLCGYINIHSLNFDILRYIALPL